MKGPALVFLHIPKTAGTSQQFEFNKYVGTEHVFWIGRDCPPGVLRYPRSQIGDRWVVGGHKHLSFYPRRFNPLYCAVLRDPVMRAISLFVYYTRPEMALTEHDRQSRAKSQAQMLSKGIDPDSMLNSLRNSQPFRREISNCQCRYLSRGPATFADVRKSLRDSDFLIGTVGEYGRFHSELWGLLGREDATAIKANKSRDNYADRFLQDEELLSLIRELNREDQQLVDWVETEQQGLWLQLKNPDKRKRRFDRLPRKPDPHKVRRAKWPDAPVLWPPRGPETLDWPLSRTFVSERHRLLYLPVPGAVDRIIQRMILEVSGIAHSDTLLQLGIDLVVAKYATGLMLRDRSEAGIEAIATAEDYFRFGIVYEPVARLIDIFRQYFVDKPDSLSEWPRIDKMIALAQGAAVADRDRGISFRQFVEILAVGKFNHRVWLPQIRYLPWPETFDGFYRPGQLSRLERDLAALRGLNIKLPKSTPVFTWTAESAVDAHYADTPSADLPADPAEWRNRLVDERILELIRKYYAGDFKLYNGIAEEDFEVADL